MVFLNYARGTANAPPVALASNIFQPVFCATSVVYVFLDVGHMFLPVGVPDISYVPFPRMVSLYPLLGFLVCMPYFSRMEN